MHPGLARWLRERRRSPVRPESLCRDLRRTQTKAGIARVASFEAGRLAWEVGDQNLSLQMNRAWKKAGIPEEVWKRRPDHAFRKALRTNTMCSTTEPGARAWQAGERLLGHALPGQIDTYQSDRALMPLMRALVGVIPRWEVAALMPLPAGDNAPVVDDDVDEDIAALG